MAQHIQINVIHHIKRIKGKYDPISIYRKFFDQIQLSLMIKTAKRAPWWLSRLRIWHCHCYGTSLISGLGTSAYHRRTKKKKKKKKRETVKKLVTGGIHFNTVKII